MHVIVLGSGVIGIATAWYLARAGVEVTVIDRQEGPALETSFANAGMVAPGYSSPWAAPGVPLKAIKWLLRRHGPLALRADGSLFQLRWMVKMLRNCTSARYAINKRRMLRLATYSRDCLRELRSSAGIRYEERSRGTLQLFREQAQADAADDDLRVLDECGIRYRMLERNNLGEVEPALEPVKHRLVGGLHLPDDETGDCHLFALRLAHLAAAAGVRFRYGTSIDALETDTKNVVGVRIGGETLRADRYVLALGSYSRNILTALGIDLPVYPVKGYSITIPVAETRTAPESSILDETYKVAITRFDDRIRVGGMAELGGFDLHLDPRRRATLELVAADLFPGCGQVASRELWAGLRPMTPDGTPVIGATPYPELFLNTGHGSLGWTMACGSARVVSDLVTGTRPEIRHDDLGLERYGKVAVSHIAAKPTASSR